MVHHSLWVAFCYARLPTVEPAPSTRCLRMVEIGELAARGSANRKDEEADFQVKHLRTDFRAARLS